jgi:integrase
LDRDWTRITVTDHKTDTTTALPIVQMIVDQLRAVLIEARRRNPGRYVVAYRGQRVRKIHAGVRSAALRAGLVYGRDRTDGVTFHTIRHAMATLFATLKPAGKPLSEAQRAALVGHADLGTTQDYTHLNPVHELEPLEVLSAQLPLVEHVNQPWRRWTKRRATAGPIAGPPLIETHEIVPKFRI